ncbi:MAG: hypothetical protein FWE46_06405 [Coriobacteriia bacterium]|nr:hypothetical protein [Coriobacteriia bacterium]MCL2537115.1 hypothetical protein [Coriobacteriia bacterium]
MNELIAGHARRGRRKLSINITFTLFVVLAISIFALSASNPARAFAAEATPAVAAVAEATGIETVTSFETLNLKVLHVEDMWVGLLSGHVAEGTALPALIEVAVPAGAHVGWFGQMPAMDNFNGAVQFPEPYLVRNEGAIDVYSGVLTNFNYTQLEFRMDSDPSSTGADGEMIMSLAYTPAHEVGSLVLASAFPAGYVSRDEGIDFLGAGPDGEQTYFHRFENAPGGVEQRADITAVYVGTGAAQAGTDTTTIVIIACISVALIAGVYFFFVRGKSEQ